MKTRFRLKKWEFALVLASILIFLFSLGVYVTGFPLRKYILGMQDDEGQLVLVGHLGSGQGEIRRQLVSEAEFKDLETAAPLYNLDTIVTGSEGGAKLQLEDGGVIELGPNTMVKLVFDTQLTLGGITRAASVNVVSGTVTGESKTQKITLRSKEQVVPIALSGRQTVRVGPVAAPKPKPIVFENPKPVVPIVTASPIAPPPPSPGPSPSPSPAPSLKPAPKFVKRTMRLELLTPKGGAHLVVAKGSAVPQVPITFGWRFTGVAPNYKMSLVLSKMTHTSRTELMRKPVESAASQGAINWIIKSPGTYEWQLLGEQGEPLPLITPANARAQFVVDPEFEGIEVLDALVGGQAASSNLLKGDLVKTFDITLRWKQYSDFKNYHIWFGANEKSAKALLEKDLHTNEYKLNKGKLFTGTIFYKVTAKLPSGFLASSGALKFSFNFLPPILVVPEDKVFFTKKQLRHDDNSILFTWQKTNFTEKYELEIGLDPDFKQAWVKRMVKENYFVLKAPQPGKYYWRVRSFSKELASGFSKGNAFEIQPQ